MNSKKRNKYAYLYLAPFFIVFLIFSVFPIVYSFVLSFCNMDVLSGKFTFTGLDNYKRMIDSGYFFKSILNTLLIWIMSIIPQLTIAFILSLILSNKWFRGKFILRNLYYFPNLVTPVTIGLLLGFVFLSWRRGQQHYYNAGTGGGGFSKSPDACKNCYCDSNLLEKFRF